MALLHFHVFFSACELLLRLESYVIAWSWGENNTLSTAVFCFNVFTMVVFIFSNHGFCKMIIICLWQKWNGEASVYGHRLLLSSTLPRNGSHLCITRKLMFYHIVAHCRKVVYNCHCSPPILALPSPCSALLWSIDQHGEEYSMRFPLLTPCRDFPNADLTLGWQAHAGRLMGWAG